MTTKPCNFLLRKGEGFGQIITLLPAVLLFFAVSATKKPCWLQQVCSPRHPTCSFQTLLHLFLLCLLQENKCSTSLSILIQGKTTVRKSITTRSRKPLALDQHYQDRSKSEDKFASASQSLRWKYTVTISQNFCEVSLQHSNTVACIHFQLWLRNSGEHKNTF